MSLLDSFDGEDDDIYDSSIHVKEFIESIISTDTAVINFCCGEEMNVDNEAEWICKSCGKTLNIVHDLSKEKIDTTIYVNVSGSLAKKQRYIISTNKDQYKKIRYGYILAKIKDMNNGSKFIKLSDQILAKARDICIEILNKQTYRNEVLKEIIAMSINVACICENIYYKENEIAKFVRLKTNSFPTGNSIITNALANKELSVDISLNITDFNFVVSSYFNKIDILDAKYIPTVIELCEITMKKQILSHYIMSSKVIGSIWCVIKLLNIDINENEYEQIVNSKKTTFSKYFSEMYKYKRFINPVLDKIGLKLEN